MLVDDLVLVDDEAEFSVDPTHFVGGGDSTALAAPDPLAADVDSMIFFGGEFPALGAPSHLSTPPFPKPVMTAS